MDYSLNYSAEAAELVRHGRITIDRFKCAAWPSMIASAEKLGPVYVHFPLQVGTGTGGAVNSETDAPPDWDAFERMLETTSTPWINVHLAPKGEDYPEITAESTATKDVRRMTDALLRDLEAVVTRFGADRVIAENVFGAQGLHPRAAILPEVVREVIETTDCGLLLDLSHARLAAEELGMPAEDYIEALPVSRIRETHVTGIQRFSERWVKHARAAGMEAEMIHGLEGRAIDHLPMTTEDFAFLAWSLARIRDGSWRTPEIIAFEYGGLGDFFKATTIKQALAVQVPRMVQLVKGEVMPWTAEGGLREPFWSSY